MAVDAIDPTEFLAKRGAPQRESCVLRYVLERNAQEAPEQVYVVFENGDTWTYRQTLEYTRRAAAGLHRLGVRQGDRVLSWLPSGPEALLVWFGANWIGAIYAPINTSYRAALLQHVVAKSRAKIMVAEGKLIGRLGEIELGALETLVANGPETIHGKLRRFDLSQLREYDEDVSPEQPIEPWHTQQIIYTSGTTGPSKGVLVSYLHHAHSALSCFEGRVHPGMRYLTNLPLFHAGGTIVVYGMLLLGQSFSLVQSFKTETFWPLVRSTRTTACTLLGVMATFLLKQPPSGDDRDNPLQWIYMLPLLESAKEFADRFGVTIYTLFNMTETSCPIISEANCMVMGSCGKVRRGVEARIVDENDFEVPDGTVGELVIRTDQPWALNHGYDGEPEATANAWRNGWFHTGDGLRRDAQGNYYFVDRLKDAIRRRGENISSFEIESVIVTHPDVLEAAAVGVPSEYSENEVLAFVVPVQGATIDCVELTEFLRDRMAHFMVPRYIRVLDQLPKTPTAKIQKHVLRAQGVDSQTWDREAAGISLKREKF